MNEQSIVELEQKSSMSEEDNLIIDTINKFLEKDVKPFVKEFESEDKYPQMIADKMAELGLFGATISPEYGGLGSVCCYLFKNSRKCFRSLDVSFWYI
jgi:alkylation response protein AidB-like acyl-CoA dehydrogenase